MKLTNKEKQERAYFGKLIGKNHRMQALYNIIEDMSSMSPTVLITGETGTGKGLLSRAIHEYSDRKDNSFVTVDCGSIPETLLESELFGHEKGAYTGALRRRIGKFEEANHGTLFLDEIGDISGAMQQRLLRVLQDRELERLGSNQTIHVDVRVIAASNKNLYDMVESGEFREDLFYRLNIIPLELPPLRERLDDLPVLIAYFLNQYRKKLKKNVRTISQQAVNKMMKYHWPGNIRELENVIERSIIMNNSPSITDVNLPGERRNKKIYSFGEIDTTVALKEIKARVIAELEKKYFNELLRKWHGNVGDVARYAGVDNKTLYEKMRKYDLKKEDFKSKPF